MAVCYLASVDGAKYLKYKDPKQPIAIRIKALMKKTTLEEKIGQMTQIDEKVASNVIKKCIVNCCCVLSLCIDVSSFGTSKSIIKLFHALSGRKFIKQFLSV